MNREQMDKLACDVRAALDEWDNILDESFQYGRDHKFSDAENKYGKSMDAIHSKIAYHATDWLTALLSERARLLKIEAAARALVEADKVNGLLTREVSDYERKLWDELQAAVNAGEEES